MNPFTEKCPKCNETTRATSHSPWTPHKLNGHTKAWACFIRMCRSDGQVSMDSEVQVYLGICAPYQKRLALFVFQRYLVLNY